MGPQIKSRPVRQVQTDPKSKLRCPFVPASQRPQCHVVGLICHGWFEAYLVMDTDQAKDASMNATIISWGLDAVKDMLKGNALPRHLVVAADNTSRESKNAIFAKYVAFLVSTSVFESAEVSFLRATQGILKP